MQGSNPERQCVPVYLPSRTWGRRWVTELDFCSSGEATRPRTKQILWLTMNGSGRTWSSGVVTALDELEPRRSR